MVKNEIIKFIIFNDHEQINIKQYEVPIFFPVCSVDFFILLFFFFIDFGTYYEDTEMSLSYLDTYYVGSTNII